MCCCLLPGTCQISRTYTWSFAAVSLFSLVGFSCVLITALGMDLGYQTVGGFPSSPNVPLFGTAERSSGVRFKNFISTVGIPFKTNFQNEMQGYYFKCQQSLSISLQIVYVAYQTCPPTYYHTAYCRGRDVSVSHLQSLCRFAFYVVMWYIMLHVNKVLQGCHHKFRQKFPDAPGPNRKKKKLKLFEKFSSNRFDSTQ